MLKRLSNNQAQTTLGEYLLVVLIIVGVLTTMGVYFRRALQARVYDATKYVRHETLNRTNGVFNGEIAYEYEPYYTQTQSLINTQTNQVEQLLGRGMYKKTIDDSVVISTSEQTAPPKEAD